MKYHVNPETGRPNICRAEGQCPLKSEDGETAKHFDNKDDARKYSETMLEEKHGLFGKAERKTKVKKQSKNDSDTMNIVKDKAISLEDKRAVLKEYLNNPENRKEVQDYFRKEGDDFEESHAHNIIMNGGNSPTFRKALKEIDDNPEITTSELLSTLDQIAYQDGISTYRDKEQYLPRVVDNAASFDKNGNLLSDEEILYGDPEKLELDDEDAAIPSFVEYDEDFSDDEDEEF